MPTDLTAKHNTAEDEQISKARDIITPTSSKKPYAIIYKLFQQKWAQEAREN